MFKYNGNLFYVRGWSFLMVAFESPKESIPICLGIDQGLANCGYAFVSTEGIVCSGTIKTEKNLSKGNRLLQIEQQLTSLIKKYKPKIVSCEKLFFNIPNSQGRNKSNAMMDVNMVSGIIQLIATKENIEFVDFAPTTIKKNITGNGRAKKDEVRKKIIEQIKCSPKTEHEVDAIAIALISILYLENKENGGEIDEKKT